MMFKSLVDAMNAIVNAQARDAAPAARALGFDLAATQHVSTPKGYVAPHDVPVSGVSGRVSLVYDAARREWTMTDLEPLGVKIDRTRSLGARPSRHPSKMGGGYAITFETFAQMMLTASGDEDRLQTLSVRMLG